MWVVKTIRGKSEIRNPKSEVRKERQTFERQHWNSLHLPPEGGAPAANGTPASAGSGHN
jgi:hypothetical protein